MAIDKIQEVWLRVGMTIQAPQSVIDKIQEGDVAELDAVFSGQKGRLFLDGEAYIPHGAYDNQVKEDIEFDLNKKEVKFQFEPECIKDTQEKGTYREL